MVSPTPADMSDNLCKVDPDNIILSGYLLFGGLSHPERLNRHFKSTSKFRVNDSELTCAFKPSTNHAYCYICPYENISISQPIIQNWIFLALALLKTLDRF